MITKLWSTAVHRVELATLVGGTFEVFDWRVYKTLDLNYRDDRI